MKTSTRMLRGALVLPMVSALLGGCVYKSTTERTVPVPVATASPDRSVTYPEGRYQLYGDGTTTPFYWVWIPAGAAPPMLPPPPPVPRAQVR